MFITISLTDLLIIVLMTIYYLSINVHDSFTYLAILLLMTDLLIALVILWLLL